MHEEAAEVGCLDSEAPRFMGNYEIRALLGVSRQRVHRITHLDGFPAPVAELASGWVWLAADVGAWIRAHRPNLHRPEPGVSEAEAGPLGERQDEDERRESDGRP